MKLAKGEQKGFSPWCCSHRWFAWNDGEGPGREIGGGERKPIGIAENRIES